MTAPAAAERIVARSTLRPERLAAYCASEIAKATTSPARRSHLEAVLVAARRAVATVRCTRCGAPLTDPASVARRMGECCAAKTARVA